jgi:aminoglycoside 3-N-acetyltransferase
LRRSWTKLDRVIDRRTLDEAELHTLLVTIGFRPGAVVMVHSSMDEISRRVVSISPLGFIRMLMDMVGPSGTILMPTFPFRGKQLHYVERRATFDVRRTPSQVGLITEVFRRMPDVVRSSHPTHPVAAWGRNALALTSEPHFGSTFGVQSPICRLRELGGVVAGIGTGMRDSFTILHVAEELHPRARGHFFESASRTMTVLEGDRRFEYPFCALRADVHRNYDRVERALTRDGTLRYVSANGLRCAFTDADVFIRRSMRLVDEGHYL